MLNYTIPDDLVGRDDLLMILGTRISASKNRGLIFHFTGYIGVGKSTILREVGNISTACGYITIMLNISPNYGGNPYYGFKWVVEKLEELDKKYASVSDYKLPLALLPTMEMDMTNVVGEPLPMELEHLSTENTLENFLSKGIDDIDLEQYLIEKLKKMSTKHPVTIIFDDFHNADKGSIKLLERVSVLSADHPLYIAISSREDLVSPLLKETLNRIATNTTILRFVLEPLTQTDVNQFVEKKLSNKNVPADFTQWLFKKSGGNPFFMNEMFYEAIKTNVIQKKDDGRWGVTGYINVVTISEGTRTAIAEMLRDLTQDELTFLQIGSVTGNVFSVNIVRHVMNISSENLNKIIKKLETKRILIKITGGVLSFNFSLTRDLILSQMSKGRKRLYNKLIADVIVKYGDTTKPTVIYQIASHYYDAMMWDKAYKYCIMAGNLAKKSIAVDMAYTYYRKASVAMDEIDISAGEKCDLYNKLGDLTHSMGKWEDSLAYYSHTYNLAKEEKNEHLVAEAAIKMARIEIESNNFDIAEEYLIEALNIFNDMNDLKKLKEINGLFGYLYWHKGLPDKAWEKLNAAIAIQIDEPSINGVLYIDLGNLTFEKKDYDKAREYYTKAIEFLSKTSDMHNLARAYNNLGEMFLNTNDIDHALYNYEMATNYAEKSDNRDLVAWTLINRTTCEIKHGNIQNAIKLNNKAQTILDEIDDKNAIAVVQINFAHIYETLGDLELVDSYYLKAMTVIESTPNQFLKALTLYNYGKYLYSVDKMDKAMEKLQRAKEIFDKIEVKTYMEDVEKLLNKIRTN